MPKNSTSLNRSLFELLRSKGYDPTLLSTNGKETPTPEEAEVFQFNFVKDGEDYGKVTMSIDGLHKLVIYYDDDIANSEKETDESGDLSWYQLLNQLKKFAQKYQLGFELRNVSNLKHDMAKREYMKKQEKIAEGYYPMGKKASYNDSVPSVKIVLQHTRHIEEGEQRYRNIAKIFLENETGERFLAPTTKPGIARVYARHIAEGGVPNDDKWNHIKSLCEEYQKMAGFVRATRNGQFNESTQRLIAEGINHYQKLRETLSKLSGHRGYTSYFESYTPPLMEDDTDTSSLNELFVQETMDPRIESVMPILAKLSKNISEMSEVAKLAEWADSLVEDESLTSNNPVGIPEGRLDGESDIDSPVADAITRRILMQRTDLLAKHGPEKVADAIAQVSDYVGDFIGPDDEIGSSDVSGWIKQVERELSGNQLEESHMSEVDSIIQDLINGELDAYTVMNHPKTPQEEYVAKLLLDQYEDVAREHRLHPDDNFEEILDIVVNNMAHDYGRPDLEEGIGDVVKKVGGALKTGAKAISKAIVGPDDDERLVNLKKDAGVRNPQTGKPSMGYSTVSKVDEISADPAYLRAAERSKSQAQATQRTFGKSPEEKAAARRTELKREKGIAGYSKRHKAEHPEMYPKVTPRPAAKLRDPSTEYSDDYSTWAKGRRDTMEQGVNESSKEKTPGIALSKAYKKDFDDKKPGHDRKETALTGAYSKTGKPGGELKKQGVSEGDDRGDYYSTARAANQASRTAKSKQDHTKAADLHDRAATYALSAGQDQSVIRDHQMAAHEHNRASKGLKEQGVAEGTNVFENDQMRPQGKILKSLRDMAIASPTLTFQNFRQAGKESIVDNAIMAAKQLKRYYQQQGNQGTAQFIYNLENELDDFRRGYNSSTDNLDLSDLLRGTLGKIQFQTNEGVAEDLDANQKRVGQLGPTEKITKKNPLRGKLVGANESVGQSMTEGLDPVKKRRLYDLIELYRDATEPNDYYDRDVEDPDEVIAMIRSEFGDKIAGQVEAGAHKMHFPRHGIQRSDPLGWKKPVDRITKAGKMYKQDSDYMKNTIKSRYKLSGKSATESMAEGLNEMDSEGYKGTRDDGNKGPEAKAKPIKAKDFAKDAEKKLNKEMDKAHKKDVKEGQEDLDAILRIIKK